jgi:hypothetical protein
MADRLFKDDLPTLKISTLRASGAVTLAMKSVVVFDGTEVRVRHSLFPNGGSWTYFICPACAGQAMTIRLLDGRALCGRCDGLHYRCQHDDKSGRLGRLREALFGPKPAKHNRKRLERALRRALIVERTARLSKAGHGQ